MSVSEIIISFIIYCTTQFVNNNHVFLVLSRAVKNNAKVNQRLLMKKSEEKSELKFCLKYFINLLYFGVLNENIFYLFTASSLATQKVRRVTVLHRTLPTNVHDDDSEGKLWFLDTFFSPLVFFLTFNNESCCDSR